MPWQKTRSRSAAPSDGARPPGLALREAGRRRTRNPRTSNHSAPTRSNLQLFPEKTAVAGFIRRHQLMEFEKSRLEDLLAYLFCKIPGVRLIGRNVLTQDVSGEIDLIFWNDKSVLEFLPNVLMFECKNWDGRVDSASVSFFNQSQSRSDGRWRSRPHRDQDLHGLP